MGKQRKRRNQYRTEPPKSKENFWYICHTKFTWRSWRIPAAAKGQTVNGFSTAVCAPVKNLGLQTSAPALAPGLELINTPEEILADSALYLDIYVLGLPFMFFYNIATGIFSALGDSKTPFYFLAVSSLSNIGVDILFVAGFKMGIAGVAWATFLCQGVSCVLAVAFVLKRLADIKLAVIFSINMYTR